MFNLWTQRIISFDSGRAKWYWKIHFAEVDIRRVGGYFRNSVQISQGRICFHHVSILHLNSWKSPLHKDEVELLPIVVIAGGFVDLLQVRMAVFSQHHVDGLDLSSTPLLYMAHCFPVSIFLHLLSWLPYLLSCYSCVCARVFQLGELLWTPLPKKQPVQYCSYCCWCYNSHGH